MNYANNLIVNGNINARNLMLAAHAKSKSLDGSRSELLKRFGVSRTYAEDFKEALAFMWQRAKQMQRMRIAA